MKRRVWLGIAVLVLLAAAVMPVMAEGDKNRVRWQGNVFSLVGEVTAVDTEYRTITVEVHTGNRQIKAYIGEELTINTRTDTMFLRLGEIKCEVITLEDVAEGDYVSVSGHMVDTLFVAKRVTVGVPLHSRK